MHNNNDAYEDMSAKDHLDSIGSRWVWKRDKGDIEADQEEFENEDANARVVWCETGKKTGVRI